MGSAVIGSKPTAKAPYSAMQILLVEDDWAFRNVITRQFRRLGCSVQSSGNASEFLANFLNAQGSTDLVVVDLQLPGIKGDKIISWIRQSEVSGVRALPILVITGHPDALRLSDHADGYPIRLLRKPYRFSQLQDAVTQLLVNGTKH